MRWNYSEIDGCEGVVLQFAGESGFKTYAEGSIFSVAANGSFDIHTGAEAAHYVCSFG